MNLNLGDTQLILRECERYGCLRNQAAYLLATAYHETAHTMKPITEYGGRAYFNKYEPTTEKGRELGNTQPGDGYKFRGHGYVQMTGRTNFGKGSKANGVDLIANPSLALRPDIAARNLVAGCMEGWYTGRSIPRYITLTKSDFVEARRVVNGKDRAATIAGYAQQYDDALKAAGYGETKLPTIVPTAPNIFGALIKFFSNLTKWKPTK